MMLGLYFALALGVSFLCSLLESVLLSVPHSHAHMLERDGKRAGRRWLDLKADDSVKPLTAILTLNTIAHTVGALGVGVEVEEAFPGEYTVVISSALLTIAILLLSEILPKTLGTAYWRQLAPAAASTLIWMVRVLRPVIAIITWFKRALPSPDSAVVTREDLAALADIGEAEGAIEEGEEAVIINVLNLRNVEVREIMTPRVVVKAWPSTYVVRDALSDDEEALFSRIPLYGDSMDDLKGFVLRSEILAAAAHGEWDRAITEFVKEPLSVAPDQTLEELFRRLIHSRAHIAFVQDEFGGTSGIVTLEDVIETLIGEEIMDEADEVADMRELARQKAEARGDGAGGS